MVALENFVQQFVLVTFFSLEKWWQKNIAKGKKHYAISSMLSHNLSVCVQSEWKIDFCQVNWMPLLWWSCRRQVFTMPKIFQASRFTSLRRSKVKFTFCFRGLSVRRKKKRRRLKEDGIITKQQRWQWLKDFGE